MFKDVLRSAINSMDPEDELIDRIMDFVSPMKDWPNVKDDDGIEEPLDFENFELVELEEDRMVISAGGDWQDPLTLTLSLNEQDQVHISLIEPGYRSDSITTDELEEYFK